MINHSNLLLGFLIGLSAGTALGLLLKNKPKPAISHPMLPHVEKLIGKRIGESLQNTFRAEYPEDFEDHVEHI